MEEISPWRFAAPLSPDMAAAREGKMLDMDAVVAFCKEHAKRSGDMLLVEGVGGIMTPLSGHNTVLDWIKALDWPVIMVMGSYLGSLSHMLTALEVLHMHRLTIKALVVSESLPQDVALTDTVDSLKKFLPPHISLATIPRMGTEKELWKTAPLLSGICDDR